MTVRPASPKPQSSMSPYESSRGAAATARAQTCPQGFACVGDAVPPGGTFTCYTDRDAWQAALAVSEQPSP